MGDRLEMKMIMDTQFPSSSLSEESFAQILASDLQDGHGSRVFPRNLETATNLPGDCVAQVEHAVNLMQSQEQKKGGTTSFGRCLKIALTDGHKVIFGLELIRCPCFTSEPPRGTKVCLRNVPVKDGMLLLQPDNINVLWTPETGEDDVEDDTPSSKPTGMKKRGNKRKMQVNASDPLQMKKPFPTSSGQKSAEKTTPTSSRTVTKAGSSESKPRPISRLRMSLKHPRNDNSSSGSSSSSSNNNSKLVAPLSSPVQTRKTLKNGPAIRGPEPPLAPETPPRDYDDDWEAYESEFESKISASEVKKAVKHERPPLEGQKEIIDITADSSHEEEEEEDYGGDDDFELPFLYIETLKTWDQKKDAYIKGYIFAISDFERETGAVRVEVQDGSDKIDAVLLPKLTCRLLGTAEDKFKVMPDEEKDGLLDRLCNVMRTSKGLMKVSYIPGQPLQVHQIRQPSDRIFALKLLARIRRAEQMMDDSSHASGESEEFET
eukprot:jgi/Bigna1/147258/aug1.135_g21966